MLQGIDVSTWQGQINWDDVEQDYKSGKLSFVAIRATYSYQGNLLMDEEFIPNAKQARERGILCGFYHYAEPNKRSAQVQADFFASAINLQHGEFAFLDYEEDTIPNAPAWVDAFNNQFANHYSGYRELVYMDLSIEQKYDWSDVIKHNDGLILAQYTFDPNAQIPKLQWPTVAFRQYSDKGSQTGINGAVDLDEFLGDQSQLLAYTLHTTNMHALKILIEGADYWNGSYEQVDDANWNAFLAIWNPIKSESLDGVINVSYTIDGETKETVQPSSRSSDTKILQDQLSSANTTISDLTTKLQAATTQYVNETAQVQGLKDTISTLQSQVLDAQTNYQKEQAKTAALTTQLTSTTNQLTQLQTSAKGYVASQQQQSQTLSAQQDTIAKLMAQIKELTSQLNYHKLLLDLQGKEANFFQALGTLLHHFFHGRSSGTNTTNTTT